MTAAGFSITDNLSPSQLCKQGVTHGQVFYSSDKLCADQLHTSTPARLSVILIRISEFLEMCHQLATPDVWSQPCTYSYAMSSDEENSFSVVFINEQDNLM